MNFLNPASGIGMKSNAPLSVVISVELSERSLRNLSSYEPDMIYFSMNGLKIPVADARIDQYTDHNVLMIFLLIANLISALDNSLRDIYEYC